MRKICFPILSLLFLSLLFGCSNDANDNGPETPKVVDKIPNRQGTGDSAVDLLSNGTFSNLRIEIAYVTGFRPTQAAMDGFVAYLKQHTFKENIELVYNELASPKEEKLTLEEIDKLEEENRTAYNDGDTLAIYIYFSDAPAEEDDEAKDLVTLGAVYRNTSMIIHEATVRKLADQSIFISDADVESSTLNHEFGHLFGLVNLGISPVNDHEDVQKDDMGEPVLDDQGKTSGNSHCNVAGCLMNAELQFGGASAKSTSLTAKNENGVQAACRLSGKSVLHMLSSQTAKGGLAPDLDSECILDLQTNGGR
ncbi:hypothetical protein SAMN05421636_103181 [Pricia antarctica]|uniref:Membrane metalloprotease n=1 Tax=Pricia antarctica TaxID=641691 RepID=A0A1G7A0J7_9FLAO|nr:hypothetical protein [Pricia antarctica]SDE08339.1 hypothetical protein SAMN05421636_103181 [Pricia antarctica]